MRPDPGFYWSEDRTLDIKESFANVINKCKEEKAELLLISGDLFHESPLTTDLNFINDLFKTIPDTRIMIVAGSSDHIRMNSPILSYRFADNVYYFKNQLPEEIQIKDTKIIVHGFSHYSKEELSPLVNSLNVDKDENIHILLCYGGDNRHCPIDFSKLNKKNLSYIALGGNHNFTEVIDNLAFYSGSLEPLCSNETGDHGIIIGEINDNTKRLSNIRLERMSKVSYVPLKLSINPGTTPDSLTETLTKEIIKNGAKNIFKIELIGERNPDTEFSSDLFSKKIRISDFVDSSVPKYDFVKLSEEHPDDLIGAYIRKMTNVKHELSDIEKKALFLGVHALIKSS